MKFSENVHQNLPRQHEHSLLNASVSLGEIKNTILHTSVMTLTNFLFHSRAQMLLTQICRWIDQTDSPFLISKSVTKFSFSGKKIRETKFCYLQYICEYSDDFSYLYIGIQIPPHHCGLHQMNFRSTWYLYLN